MKRVPEHEPTTKAETRLFAEFLKNSVLVQQTYQSVATQVRNIVPKVGPAVLEAGAGPGYLTIAISQVLEGRQAQVIGVDSSTEILALAWKNAREIGADSNCAFRRASLTSLPFSGASFDCVVSCFRLRQWAEPVKVLGEIRRVLKPAGLLLIYDLRRPASILGDFGAWLAASGYREKPGVREALKRYMRSGYSRTELEELLIEGLGGEWEILQEGLTLVVRSGWREVSILPPFVAAQDISQKM